MASLGVEGLRHLDGPIAMEDLEPKQGKTVASARKVYAEYINTAADVSIVDPYRLDAEFLS